MSEERELVLRVGRTEKRRGGPDRLEVRVGCGSEKPSVGWRERVGCGADIPDVGCGAERLE